MPTFPDDVWIARRSCNIERGLGAGLTREDPRRAGLMPDLRHKDATLARREREDAQLAMVSAPQPASFGATGRSARFAGPELTRRANAHRVGGMDPAEKEARNLT